MERTVEQLGVPALNTLVVLVAVYFAGASICSFVNEVIAGALQLRGSNLYRGLVDLVCGWREIVDKLYQHPLVYQGNIDETPTYGPVYRFWSFVGAENNWPSYVDARNFSVAFWQTLQGVLTGNLGAAVASAAATTPQQLVEDLKARINGVNPATPGLGPLKQTLSSMLTQAGNDYEKLLTLTDAWFNKQMDRISGWYRRTAQWILLVFGVAIGFGLNVDTIHIVTFFNTESALASHISDTIAAAYPPSKPANPAANAPAIPEKQTADAIANAWSALDQSFSANNVPLQAFMNPGSRPLSSILGDLITAIAFAMGAPFWFDLLGKLVNVRMAGQKPKEQKNATNAS